MVEFIKKLIEWNKERLYKESLTINSASVKRRTNPYTLNPFVESNKSK